MSLLSECRHDGCWGWRRRPRWNVQYLDVEAYTCHTVMCDVWCVMCLVLANCGFYLNLLASLCKFAHLIRRYTDESASQQYWRRRPNSKTRVTMCIFPIQSLLNICPNDHEMKCSSDHCVTQTPAETLAAAILRRLVLDFSMWNRHVSFAIAWKRGCMVIIINLSLLSLSLSLLLLLLLLLVLLLF